VLFPPLSDLNSEWSKRQLSVEKFWSKDSSHLVGNRLFPVSSAVLIWSGRSVSKRGFSVVRTTENSSQLCYYLCCRAGSGETPYHCTWWSINFFFLQRQWTFVVTSVDVNVFPKQTLALLGAGGGGGGNGPFRPLCVVNLHEHVENFTLFPHSTCCTAFLTGCVG